MEINQIYAIVVGSVFLILMIKGFHSSSEFSSRSPLLYPRISLIYMLCDWNDLSKNHICHCSEILACLHLPDNISFDFPAPYVALLLPIPVHSLTTICSPSWKDAATVRNCLLNAQSLAKNCAMSSVRHSWGITILCVGAIRGST